MPASRTRQWHDASDTPRLAFSWPAVLRWGSPLLFESMPAWCCIDSRLWRPSCFAICAHSVGAPAGHAPTTLDAPRRQYDESVSPVSYRCFPGALQ